MCKNNKTDCHITPYLKVNSSNSLFALPGKNLSSKNSNLFSFFSFKFRFLKLFFLENFTFLIGSEFIGNNIVDGFVASLNECITNCSQNLSCLSFSFVQNLCYLKFRFNYKNSLVANSISTSGFIRIEQGLFLFYLFSLSNFIYFIFIVLYCTNLLKNVQNIEYLENKITSLRDSTSEECCLTCYYNINCASWQIHIYTKICTITLKNNIYNGVSKLTSYLKQRQNTFFISGSTLV